VIFTIVKFIERWVVEYRIMISGVRRRGNWLGIMFSIGVAEYLRQVDL
jgi:hypothetical protein